MPVDGAAFGGTPPYTFAWTHEGSGARFADASAAATTFSAAGLAEGPVDVVLTVTDSVAATASATVRLHHASSSLLLDVTDVVLAGAPDEIFLLRPVDGQTYTFDVPPGTARIDAVLDWGSGSNDLDLALHGPDGTRRTGTAGETEAKPERVHVVQPEAGTWTAWVKPWLTLPEEFTLKVVGAPPVDLPRLDPLDTYSFGRLDAHVLPAKVRGGTAPHVVAWDTDLDGVYETPGEFGLADLPLGTHTVAARVVDAFGYSDRRTGTVHVRDDIDHVLRLGCGGWHDRPFIAMEFSASGGRCYMHGGHHTYWLGGEFTLTGGTAFVFSVEQQLSPPSAYEPGVPLRTHVRIEGSLDGQEWTELGVARYTFLQLVGLPQRQGIHVTLAPSDAPFSFVRFAQPPSAAQGLSGFLDSSYGQLLLDRWEPAGLDAPPAKTKRVVHLSCEAGDVLEDFFAEHPCWFGGVDRYDAASFFHTYLAPEGASLDRVAGRFTVLPWRSDDWFTPIPAPVERVTHTTVFVETSTDGREWTRIGAVAAAYGTETPFNLKLDAPLEARFVRLVPDAHARFHDPSVPPLHHLNAFFLHSALRLHGTM